ncbi:hypothetical protein [Pseudoduganella sp. R-34]|uniref:hypothetical protein n=1 Tax=Pseudoduganella sp. R-34 TaxID=3404062 RepID=UPI003CF02BBA
MNARLMQPLEENGISLSNEELWREVDHLLASPTFAKAPRMCRLLTFLLEKKLSGNEQEINEYAIGLDLFGRDASTYDTSLDPQVRVQIGRLRQRLSAYYAALEITPAIHVSIPMGSYVPVIACPGTQPKLLRYKRILLTPLRNLTGAGASNTFVCGLDEELGSRLFQTLGKGLQVSAVSDANQSPRLEGSVRVEDDHVRASIRLVDPGAGSIAWLSQFDRRGELCMSLQEELAGAICDALQFYLVDHRGRGMFSS